MTMVNKRKWLQKSLSKLNEDVLELKKDIGSNSEQSVGLPNPNGSIQNSELESIAIVGLDGSFPKCQTVEDFWEALEQNQNLIEEIPRNRFK